MSGHSHYATIKRQKEAKDAVRGKVFSKMARAISIAVKTGGGPDLNANYKLRMAIDSAKSVNMPKENIERAISKASSEGEGLVEVTYEGFGPDGVAIMVDVATDNRNRTAQEMKNILERVGGSMGGPGSVAFNFENKGLIVVEKKTDVEKQMLELIDAGAEDVEESDNAVEVYTKPEELKAVSQNLKEKGQNVISVELYQKPKNKVVIDNEQKAAKVMDFLDKLEEHDDVQKVYANIDIPTDILEKISGNE
jgi:YebC/PmpR family DNA-binding regulatory protein